MTDISSIVAQPRSITILHPATKEPIGLRISVLPDSDPKVRAVVRKQMNARLKGNASLDADQIDARRLDLIVSAGDSWEWGTGADGEPANFAGEQPPFSEQAFRKVLTQLPWIRDQIDLELGDSAAFFRSAETPAG